MKKYIIAITLFCISLILIDDAYAMTGSYTNATYSYRDCSNPLECSTSFVSPYIELATNANPTSERIRGVSMRAYNTDGVWKKGDNYNFKWRVCEQSKWGNNESITYLRNGFNFNEFTYNTNDVATGATTGDVADVTYTISDDSSSQYCWFVNFNLTPKDDLQYVGFKASFDLSNDDGGIGLYTGTWFTVGRLDINFTEGVGSIIEENSQEIIKGQEETNQKLDEVKDEIKDQFENCRDSVNLITSSLFKSGSRYSYYELDDNQSYILSIKLKENGTKQSFYLGFSDSYDSPPTNYIWLLNQGYFYGTTASDGFVYIENLKNSVRLKYVAIYPKDDSTIETLFQNYDIQLVKGSSYKPYEKYGQICSNRIDETNDKLDNLNDSLTNDSTSGATDSASSFFDSFTSEDNGGISSIITAPLNLINGMLDVNTNTCNPLSVNILGKDVDLPCGKLLWSRAPDSIVVLWQTIICGFFSYKLIVSLYHDIDKLKDPEQKGVDTLDL